ncbi:radical SAM-linked protein [Desulfitispora alkaliphila]|uniref:TIGR03936 family radical SAM-associated protein n=1 Tax=Desulfitispora alkaliphila TaxID=622674 RepID=UPI003D20E701
MYNYRIEYSVTGNAKYVSHLDLAQAFERSMRRASLPLAFSQGFNPHPKMSFGSALAVGLSSSGEYMDVELTEEWSESEFKEALNRVLPEGLHIERVLLLKEKNVKLMALINRAKYQVLIPFTGNHDIEEVVHELLARKELPVLRRTKKGEKERDIRPGIMRLEGRVEGSTVLLEMTVETGSGGNVRPEEVVQLINEVSNMSLEPEMAKYHRVGLYVQEGGQLLTPLDVGR